MRHAHEKTFGYQSLLIRRTIGLTTVVAIVSDPPAGDALCQAVLPDENDFFMIVTLAGGTVDSYITYTGAHRFLDSDTHGPGNVREITRSSVTSLLVTGAMRAVLLPAVPEVVVGGATLAADNPTASAFCRSGSVC